MDALGRHRLTLLGLEPLAVERCALPERLRAVYGAFLARVPYETLSDLRRWRERPAEPEAWLRTTDRLLGECSRDGTGGTAFSMAYALAEVFRAVGANAHTTLARRVRGEEVHAAVLVFLDDGPRLYDPAFFVPDAVPVRPDGGARDRLFRYRLVPRGGSTLTLVLRGVGEDGLPDRPLYTWIPMPAPPDEFRRAWMRSFRRCRDGCLRLARREGDALVRFHQRDGWLEVTDPRERRREDPGPDLCATLHRRFGISEAMLRAHFASAVRTA